MDELVTLRTALIGNEVTLAEAFRIAAPILRSRLTLEDSLWLENEISGYQISESQLDLADGFVEEIPGLGVPDYRKLKPSRVTTNGPLTGEVIDITITDFGQMPILQVSGIAVLEEELLPLLASGSPMGVVSDNPPARIEIDNSEVAKMFSAIRVTLPQMTFVTKVFFVFFTTGI